MSPAAVALAALVSAAAPAADVQQAPSCHYCGMDREKFGHSRMVIEYEDGKTVGTCSLHCAAVELAVAIDRVPRRILVADHDTRELVDAERAAWVLGGKEPGVMSGRAKWAFRDRAAAEAFVARAGGEIVSFEDAISAAYQDMYRDTRAIRERRRAHRQAPPARP